MSAEDPTLAALETARLALRAVTLADSAFLVRLLNEPSWLANIGDRGVRSGADAERYITARIWTQYRRYGYGMYVLELKSTRVPVGTCGLVRRDFLAGPDLGFALLPEFVGQGLAREAAARVLLHAKTQLDVRPLYAVVRCENLASVRVLERLGFQRQGRVCAPEGEDLELYVTG
jgi:[ribosomal protein S5]-alanine N-acetyltransferase